MKHVARSYKNLIVWQKAIELVVAVYELTEKLPANEKFGLVTQMQRAAVSVPSNIAEGKMRKTPADCARFFDIAYGSGAELETHVEIIKLLPLGKNVSTTKVESLLLEVMKILNTLMEQ